MPGLTILRPNAALDANFGQGFAKVGDGSDTTYVDIPAYTAGPAVGEGGWRYEGRSAIIGTYAEIPDGQVVTRVRFGFRVTGYGHRAIFNVDAQGFLWGWARLAVHPAAGYLTLPAGITTLHTPWTETVTYDRGLFTPDLRTEYWSNTELLGDVRWQVTTLGVGTNGVVRIHDVWVECETEDGMFVRAPATAGPATIASGVAIGGYLVAPKANGWVLRQVRLHNSSAGHVRVEISVDQLPGEGSTMLVAPVLGPGEGVVFDMAQVVSNISIDSTNPAHNPDSTNYQEPIGPVVRATLTGEVLP